MQKHHKLQLGLLVILVLVLVVIAQPAFALSTACGQLNGISYQDTAGTFLGTREFNAGETLFYVYRAHKGSSPDSVTLYVDGNPVDSSGMPGRVSYTFPSSDDYTVHTSVKGGTVDYVMWCPVLGGGSSQLVVPPCQSILDSRVNDLPERDCGAPVAIYHDSAIKVYGIDAASGVGQLNVDISQATIESVDIPPDVPVLLGQGKHSGSGIDIYLYRLPTGEFQLNTHYQEGKAYIFIWDEDGNAYHQAA